MRFSSAGLFAILSLSTQVFAAPASTQLSVKRDDIANDIVSSLSSTSNNVSRSLVKMNSTASSGQGFSNVITMFQTFNGVVGAFNEMNNAVSPLIKAQASGGNAIADWSAEQLQKLVNALEIYKNILSMVEQTVDAVVNAFFPGFLDIFRPYIQIWINVVDSFTDPFLGFYTNLVSSLTNSPELVDAINAYIAEIKEIRDNFLLAF